VRKGAIATALGSTCVLIGGCAGGDGETTSSRPAQAADSATTHVARVTQLRAGERAVLVRLDRVGRVIVSCDEKGRPSSAFVADRLLPTASVVVDRGGSPTISGVLQPNRRFAPPPTRMRATFETWQIAPFAKANVRVTTIWLALGPSAGEPFYACDASARAAITLLP
jgi:hypothetical protein